MESRQPLLPATPEQYCSGHCLLRGLTFVFHLPSRRSRRGAGESNHMRRTASASERIGTRPVLGRDPVVTREFRNCPFAVEAPELGVLLAAEWCVRPVGDRDV